MEPLWVLSVPPSDSMVTVNCSAPALFQLFEQKLLKKEAIPYMLIDRWTLQHLWKLECFRSRGQL